MEELSMKNVADILKDIEYEAITNRTKCKPQFKDYSKENILRIRQIQSVNKKHNEEIQKSAKTVTKPSKYNHVQPKVVSQFQPQCSRLPSCKLTLPSDKTYTNTRSTLFPNNENDQCKQIGFRTELNKTTQSSQNCARPPSVSKLHLDGNDYIRTNINEVKAKRNSSAPSFINQKNPPTSLENYQRGIVPQYLLRRQKILQEEKKKQLEENTKVEIPGYTIMPENERQETLRLLRKNEQELLRQLSSLPVGNDTLRIRQIKEDIEKQLSKLDEGIKIFSQNKVLIKND